MKNKKLLLFVFASMAVIGLIVSVYGIMNNPFILPYQDWDSIPDETKKVIYHKEKLMNTIRNDGLAVFVFAGISFFIALIFCSGQSVHAECEE